MNTKMAYAAVLVLVGLAAAPMAGAQSGGTSVTYVLGLSVKDPTTGDLLFGLIICQSPPSPLPLPVGIGGACNLDCSGPLSCTITVTGDTDGFVACDDKDGDGIDEQCTAKAFGSVVWPKKNLVDVFVQVGAVTGTITAIDP